MRFMQANHPLKTYRETQDPRLSQAALAERLGVTRHTVLRWENGGRRIDEKKVFDVARITGIPAKELRPDLVERLEQLVGAAQ
jgi:transcriptional regulator with XRE-family HTH domain